ncbi:MAG: hypothetical protein OHK0012_09770 [Synechococcales cyanobacterium]
MNQLWGINDLNEVNSDDAYSGPCIGRGRHYILRRRGYTYGHFASVGECECEDIYTGIVEYRYRKLSDAKNPVPLP